MKKSRFTEEQIIKILNEHDQGKTIEELSRTHKVSTHTLYVWRKKFSGMQVPDAKKMRELESENAKLKKLIANLSLDNMVLKDALGKK
jgi:putative transposase